MRIQYHDIKETETYPRFGRSSESGFLYIQLNADQHWYCVQNGAEVPLTHSRLEIQPLPKGTKIEITV